MCNNGHAHCPGPAESGAGSWGDTVKGAAAASPGRHRAIYTQAQKYCDSDNKTSKFAF